MTNPANCPLCGRGNQCGMVAGSAGCWCERLAIDAKVLAAIPDQQRAEACLCPDCARGAPPSPCTGVCEVDGATGECRGCGRTLDEIAGWPGFGFAEKVAVHRRLLQRRR